MLSVVRAIIILASVLAASSAAVAQGLQQPRIGDPAAFSLEIVGGLGQNGAAATAEKLGEVLAQSGAKLTLERLLAVLDKKPPRFVKILSDRDYGGAVRVVTVYSYGSIEQAPFLYFQMTYKMTDTGWVTTGFFVKNETINAFPSEFAQYSR